MATILKRNDNSILLVKEDINEFMSDQQEFYVINGGWSGIYENGFYTDHESTDLNTPIKVTVHRHIPDHGDYDKIINDFIRNEK